MSDPTQASRTRVKLHLSPQNSGLPPAALRHLLTGEGNENLTFIRQHPAIMAPALASALGVLLAAAIADLTSHHNQTLILVLWLISAIMLIRFALVALNWWGQFIVITEKNFILTAGITTRTVTALPLMNLSGMTLERSATGQLMGYGAFRLGSDGPGQLIIDYVPYPEPLYLEIRTMIRVQEDKAASG